MRFASGWSQSLSVATGHVIAVAHLVMRDLLVS